MKHKREQHWKQKRCPYWHGNGRGCRFPDSVCFNFHGREDQQQGRGAPRQEIQRQEPGRQEQNFRSQGQETGGQGSWGRISWAERAGGQREESQVLDARSRIDCRDGTSCRYFRQGECRYRHSTQTSRGQNRQSSQGQVSEGRTSSKNSTENEEEESSFNMHEMKLTLDNLVKVVYNLKSLADFPKIIQETKSN